MALPFLKPKPPEPAAPERPHRDALNAHQRDVNAHQAALAKLSTDGSAARLSQAQANAALKNVETLQDAVAKEEGRLAALHDIDGKPADATQLGELRSQLTQALRKAEVARKELPTLDAKVEIYTARIAAEQRTVQALDRHTQPLTDAADFEEFELAAQAHAEALRALLHGSGARYVSAWARINQRLMEAGNPNGVGLFNTGMLVPPLPRWEFEPRFKEQVESVIRAFGEVGTVAGIGKLLEEGTARLETELR